MVVAPVDLYAFGPKTGPRPPRPGIDLMPGPTGTVGPESPPLPQGASTFADPQQAPLTGHYHRLPRDTPLPDSLAVVADGCDVVTSSPHPPGHHTIYPARVLSPDDFVALFLALPWQYAGRKR